MTNPLKIAAALGLVLGLGLATAPELSAKAHDEGVGDFDTDPARDLGEPNAGGAGVGGQGGVSAGQRDGLRGDAASGAREDNAEGKGLGPGGVSDEVAD